MRAGLYIAAVFLFVATAADADAGVAGQVTQTNCKDSTTTAMPFTSGTSRCKAGYAATNTSSAKNADSFMCTPEAYTCTNIVSYDEAACTTEQAMYPRVCNVCQKISSSSSLSVSCSKGAVGASLMEYAASTDCTGTAVTTEFKADTCTDKTKVTGAAYGCNAFKYQVHSGAACESAIVSEQLFAQNVCIGAPGEGDKFSCPGNSDYNSSAAVSALLAVLAAVAVLVM